MDCRQSKPSELIAAFDLDHTLLKPHKGVFPKDKNDAVLVYPEIVNIFNELKNRGYKIVIFTNQKGIGKKIRLSDIYYKVNTFLPNGKDIDVYISYKSDKWRKPFPSMFDFFIKHNGPIRDIFYVGDAAGRPKDFSCSDIQFAYNCGILFYTPEEFFLKKSTDIPDIKLLEIPQEIPLTIDIIKKTVIILIGYPASGKSTLAKNIAKTCKNAVIISNDITGSSVKSFNLFNTELIKNTNVIIIDNTNPSLAIRYPYIELAKEFKYNVYAVNVQTSKNVSIHLNMYRAYTHDENLIPEVAYNMFNCRYEPPLEKEGFHYIVNYVPKLDEKIFDYSFIKY